MSLLIPFDLPPSYSSAAVGSGLCLSSWNTASCIVGTHEVFLRGLNSRFFAWGDSILRHPQVPCLHRSTRLDTTCGLSPWRVLVLPSAASLTGAVRSFPASSSPHRPPFPGCLILVPLACSSAAAVGLSLEATVPGLLLTPLVPEKLTPRLLETALTPPISPRHPQPQPLLHLSSLV